MKSVLEKWKAVPDYEGLYEVSDYGAVRSLDYQGKKRIKYLRNVKNRYGYECINLCRNGKRKQFRVHRIVWETFNGTIPAGMEIDHINAIRDDNRLDNLRVVTSKENHANPISVENHSDSMRRRSQDPKWREAQREGVKRRSQDPKWLDATREAIRKSHNKPVLQLNKTTGEVIREWECMMDVERELGINHRNISACCLNKQNTAGGYRWRFA